jgi:hypothetical protein
MSRILLGAAVALAALGTSVQSQAAEYGYHHRRAHHHHYSSVPHHYEFFSFGYPDEHYSHRPVGGDQFAWQPRSFPFINGAGYNYPGFYTNQSLWDRVQTQGNYPVQY